MTIGGDDITFYLNSHADAHLLADCLGSIRAVYASSPIIIRADGDDDPSIGIVGRRFGAEVIYGPWLFTIERGGQIVDEMLRLFLRAPTTWLFKVDPDTRVHRRFERLPTVDCIFGTVQQQGGLFSIQGGCVGFTVGAARRLHASGAARDPALARVPPPWAFNRALRDRPVERGLISVDWVVGWTARQLGIPLVDWPEILSEWQLQPDLEGDRYAVTHPHKPTMIDGAVSSSTRRWNPEWLVPGPEPGAFQAPLDSTLDVEPA